MTGDDDDREGRSSEVGSGDGEGTDEEPSSDSSDGEEPFEDEGGEGGDLSGGVGLSVGGWEASGDFNGGGDTDDDEKEDEDEESIEVDEETSGGRAEDIFRTRRPPSQLLFRTMPW